MTAHPTSVKICEKLADVKKLCVGDIMKEAKIDQVDASYNLRRLHKAGILGCKRDWKNVYYWLNKENYKKLVEFVEDWNSFGK